jgi:seryl-tRNA synthetase
VLELDRRRRELLPELEGLRAEQNAASKEIGAAKQRGEDPGAAIAAMEQLAARGRELSDQERRVDAELQAALAELPNLPDPDAPAQDTPVRDVGEAGKTGGDHLELAGERIDMESAARVSGSRFAYLKGELVLVELALARYAMARAIEHGFEPVVPPVLVRERALFGTGFLPDTEQQIYRLADDDLYLVGTSEVSLASLHADEVLDEERLPVRYAGFSTCFRREAGAAGKDTRGIFRVHQFDKVELFSFVAPDESRAEHERLLAIEEQILQELGIPYRVVDIGVDELGASAARKFDCEAWLPGQERYRELTSCSNTTAYQARRLDVRFRGERGVQPAHTLNGTAVTARALLAIMENFQDEDGSVAVPEVLVGYGAPARISTKGASVP